MMRKLFKILFIFAVLSWAAAGLRHAQGERRNGASTEPGATLNADSRTHSDIVVQGAHGSFLLKDLKFASTPASTILKGKVVNKTEHECGRVYFEVRAYGHDGQLLRGAERQTVFAVRQLKAKASAPINDGYGVWLQGIRPDRVARIEVSEIDAETLASIPARLIPLAGHALAWKIDAEVEE